MFTLFLLLVGLAASFASPVLPAQQTIGGRIVGGRDGTIEEVPYLVSVQRSGSHICGATIISDYWAVSAAHCFTRPASHFALRAGSTQRTSGGTLHPLEFYINHLSYGTPTTHANDIALLKVTVPFLFTNAVQPAALPVQSEIVPAGTSSTISGWGTLRYLIGSSPEIVQIAEVPIVSLEQCRVSYGASSITDDMLCAGFPRGRVDACQGDSGGPLVIDGVLYGAVSWGRRCASIFGYPGVYADVAYFRNWIKENSGI